MDNLQQKKEQAVEAFTSQKRNELTPKGDNSKGEGLAQKKGNKIPILKMLESGLDERSINDRVVKYKSQGHYVDPEDLDKYRILAKSQKEKRSKEEVLNDGYFSRVINSWQQRGQNIKQEAAQAFPSSENPAIDPMLAEQLEKRGMQDKVAELQEYQKIAQLSRPVKSAQLLMRSVGQVAGGVGDIFGEAAVSVGRGVSAVTPEPLKEVGRSVGSAFLETPVGDALISGIEKIDKLKEEDPETYKDIAAIGNIAAIIPIGKAVQVGKQTLTPVYRGAPKFLKAVGDDIVRSASGSIDAIKSFKPAVVTADVLKGVGQRGKNLADKFVSRVTYNKAERELIENTLNKAAKPVRNAYNQGVSIKQANIVSQSTKQELEQAKKMIESAVLESLGETPQKAAREFSGKPLVDMFKYVDDIKKSTGQKLGEVTKNIPKESIPNMKQKALEKMKEINGLKGLVLKETPEGTVLDFSGTTISKATGSQNTILKYFEDLDDLTADRIHLRRQEIFEELGGKSSAGIVLNETEDKALSAIRKAMMDELSNISPEYRALNTEYAIIEDSLKDFRKMFKSVTGSSDDVMELRAAELSRRLTGNASAQMKGLLEKMEGLSRKYGYAGDVSPIQMQEIYNIVDEYFDVARSTSLRGESAKAIKDSIPSGLSDAVGKLFENISQVTGIDISANDATTRRAFVNLIEELLSEQ